MNVKKGLRACSLVLHDWRFAALPMMIDVTTAELPDPPDS